MSEDKIDSLGEKLGNTALTLLVRLYPEVRSASTEELDAACAAMRAKTRSVLDQLMDDVRDAPLVSHIAFHNAALTLAEEGIRSLKAAKSRNDQRIAIKVK